ncbi:hypothetical protein [Streptomyces sp. NPDC050704]|uniref:hypothetical protein n=1 Tax=Streptomyces sp. NPDC050704 TaxID=3157219 RepID=UPI00341FA7BC
MISTRRTKSVVIAAALAAGTVLLTACQNDSAEGAGKSVDNAAGAAASAQAVSKAKGVSGTFTGGVVEYLAPGKYIVNTIEKDQQFFVAEDTKVFGAGVICGDYPTADTACTTDELEKVLKGGSVSADVVMKDGIATKITETAAPDEGPAVDDSADNSTPAPGNSTPEGEDRSGEGTIEGINQGKGVNGTWFGTVSYLAPGKYTVSDMKGTQQQFFIAEDTKIWGTGDICGDEDGQAATECTEADLEKAAQGAGVSAEVKISNGTATTITDDH